MGRYYSGDIEGKFWFGVQSSDDGLFFGGYDSTITEYHFDKDDDLESIEKGINECLEHLGDNKSKLDTFFKGCNGYTDKELEEVLGTKDTHPIMEWYARLILGEKIKACVLEQGYCTFTGDD